MATMNTEMERLQAELDALKVARTELDALKVADRAEPHEGTIDGEGGIYLEVGGERFECRRVSTSYQMMKFADAQRKAQVSIPSGLPKESDRYKELAAKRNAAGMAMMAIMLETVMILLKPYERERFDEFMTDISMGEGLAPQELENAIGDVIAAAGGEEGKEEPNTASQSSDSSGTTKENVQVYSLSKGGLQDKKAANE